MGTCFLVSEECKLKVFETGQETLEWHKTLTCHPNMKLLFLERENIDISWYFVVWIQLMLSFQGSISDALDLPWNAEASGCYSMLLDLRIWLVNTSCVSLICVRSKSRWFPLLKKSPSRDMLCCDAEIRSTSSAAHLSSILWYPSRMELPTTPSLG